MQNSVPILILDRQLEWHQVLALQCKTNSIFAHVVWDLVSDRLGSGKEISQRGKRAIAPVNVPKSIRIALEIIPKFRVVPLTAIPHD